MLQLTISPTKYVLFMFALLLDKSLAIHLVTLLHWMPVCVQIVVFGLVISLLVGMHIDMLGETVCSSMGVKLDILGGGQETAVSAGATFRCVRFRYRGRLLCEERGFFTAVYTINVIYAIRYVVEVECLKGDEMEML